MLERPDGRQIAYSETGCPQGDPVLYCHGIPGSRHETALLPESLRRHCRLIAMDRPGYGDSTPCDGYSFRDHALDLKALAGHLGVRRFTLMGFSGGGVFALAGAAALAPRRLVLAATPAVPLMVNPMAHAGALTAGTWQQALAAPDTLPDTLMPLVKDARTLAGTMMESLSAGDAEWLGAGVWRRAFERDMAAAVAQSPACAANAIARDIQLLVHSWGKAASECPVAPHILHGLDDALVFPAHARALAAACPGSRLELLPGCGHYGVLQAIEAGTPGNLAS